MKENPFKKAIACLKKKRSPRRVTNPVTCPQLRSACCLLIPPNIWIWVHSRLGTTAAQRADLTLEPWTWEDIAVYPTLC